ncbi:MAG: hypothetical protein Q8J64_05855 [Thermodesulfovibrionales bacterium]|nr:hypothetical protein [Thermodesulfovibrionales bacterium]
MALRIKLFFLIALVLLQASCAKKEAFIRPVLPAEKKTAVLAKGAPVTVETLRDSIIFRTIGSLRSEVSVQVFRNGQFHSSYEGLLSYQSPGQANIRLFGPMGLTAADIVLSDNLMQVYIPLKNLLYEGKIPAFTEQAGVIYSMEKNKDGYTLYAFKGQVTEEEGAAPFIELTGKYEFVAATDASGGKMLINTGISTHGKGKRFADIVLSDWAVAGPKEAVPLPLSVNISFGGFGLDMKLMEPELNTGISGDYFKPKDHEEKDVKPLKDLFMRGGDL